MACIAARMITSKTGDSVTIRSAQANDAVRLLSYIRAVAAETSFFIMEEDEFNFTVEQERHWIQEHLDGPGILALVAEVDSTIVGSLSFENGPHRRIAHRGTLGISVEKQWRSKGIGSALLKTLIEWAQADPLIEKLSLGVFADNEKAIGLYKKFGFVEEGRRPKELKIGLELYVDEIPMYRFV